MVLFPACLKQQITNIISPSTRRFLDFLICWNKASKDYKQHSLCCLVMFYKNDSITSAILISYFFSRMPQVLVEIVIVLTFQEKASFPLQLAQLVSSFSCWGFFLFVLFCFFADTLFSQMGIIFLLPIQISLKI